MAMEDMQDLFSGRQDLGLDGMILLFATVDLFAFLLIFWLRDRLLSGVEEDFLHLGIGFQEFLERVDAPAFLAGRGRVLVLILGLVRSEIAQGSIPQRYRQHLQEDRQEALGEFAADVALIQVEQIGKQVLSDVEAQIHQTHQQAFG